MHACSSPGDPLGWQVAHDAREITSSLSRHRRHALDGHVGTLVELDGVEDRRAHLLREQRAEVAVDEHGREPRRPARRALEDKVLVRSLEDLRVSVSVSHHRG